MSRVVPGRGVVVSWGFFLVMVKGRRGEGVGTCEEDDGAGFGAFDAVYGRGDVEGLVGESDIDVWFFFGVGFVWVVHVDMGGLVKGFGFVCS